MEALKRTAALLVLLLSLVGCEYLGLDGYVNQLREFGITHDLADAVSFNQALVSRPREFEGEVYVLGTRGVFVMDADDLKDYDYYPYAIDLGYDRDYDNDRLPPINCYREPSTGQVVIMALNYDQGLRFGDMLTLVNGTGEAVVSFLDPAWGNPPLSLYWDGIATRFVSTDLFNDTNDLVERYDAPAVLSTPPSSDSTAPSEYVLNRSFRTPSSGDAIFVATQIAIPFSGNSGATVSVYRLSLASWSLAAPLVTLTIPNPVFHNEPKNAFTEFISYDLAVSTNDGYIMVYGFDQEDDESFLLYDYAGKLVMERDAPDYNLNAELAEKGRVFYTSNTEGGVAKYVLD